MAVLINLFQGFEEQKYDEFGAEGGGPSEAPHNPPQSQPSFHGHPSNQPPASNFSNIQKPPGSHTPANTPAEIPHPVAAQPVKPVPVPRTMPVVDPSLLNNTQEGDVRLTPEDFTRAQKYCKYAGSALQYEDVGTAIQNLQKALKLLTTGKE
ncbi:vacuolar protein sorting-associated protein VTA1 homolog [Sinocyclocheilus rhinocerous]|uniref:vacuolar protein sorting-associated protein VTA1 homolog n=1 Tax=Sinocyclocheilus rhinocerous TaxID=307959 RepID=UPI0007B9122C|nr:PREDICTED: vacuolar protein sorting-associated protein VTA1 homolog [Sinocyclocheilus rhinocerous]